MEKLLKEYLKTTAFKVLIPKVISGVYDKVLVVAMIRFLIVILSLTRQKFKALLRIE